jgi:chemotaxis protein CheZ
MDAADVLMDLVGKLPAEESDRGMTAVTSIYEACSFQDITGQRITKVVNTLKVIEQRVDQMIGSASGAGYVASVPLPVEEPTGDQALLNGPQLPGKGRTQEEIDALLGFD